MVLVKVTESQVAESYESNILTHYELSAVESLKTYYPFVRLRFFNQMEDELQSHQHEGQWLREKGNQLAQKDTELAGEVLREICLLETTWEDTRRLITDRYWSTTW